jgi:hypothetical protein
VLARPASRICDRQVYEYLFALTMKLYIIRTQVGFFIGVFMQDDVVVNDSSFDSSCMDSVLVLEVPWRATRCFV